MPFELPKLQYAYDALEPHIDAMTMEIHHSKHHAAYINNLNKALEPYMDLQTKELEELVKELTSLPESIRTAVQNNGGGHYNHTFFWKLLTPNSSKSPEGPLADALNKEFGNFENFKMEFNKAAMGRFGSGWAWLSVDKSGKLVLTALPNLFQPLREELSTL